MPYSIHFANFTNIYFEGGLKNRRKAKKRLEEIAKCCPDECNPSGEVWSDAYGEIRFSNENISRVSIYTISYEVKKVDVNGITYEDKKVSLIHKKNKKDF